MTEAILVLIGSAIIYTILEGVVRKRKKKNEGNNNNKG